MATLSKLVIGSGVIVAAVCSILKIMQYLHNSSKNEVEDDDAEVRGRRYRSTLVKIPQHSVGAVLGRGGANIRGIEKDTKTFIKVLHYGKQNGRSHIVSRIRNSCDAEEWSTTEGHTRTQECEFAFVEIRGESEANIEHALTEIRSCIADSKNPRSTKHICVPSHVMGYIIGKDGANLREIKRNHSVHVEIGPDTGSHTRKISLTGSGKSIALAQARINQLISRHHFDDTADAIDEYEREILEIQRIREQVENDEEEW
ncbi:KH domain protein [Trichostrongylus colubriformis]|uniref:KH domain protein n=1 Tax=Trichostrongylus colubriformis TaxID=6319 RepID=A0AAN8G498_TRICO